MKLLGLKIEAFTGKAHCLWLTADRILQKVSLISFVQRGREQQLQWRPKDQDWLKENTEDVQLPGRHSIIMSIFSTLCSIPSSNSHRAAAMYQLQQRDVKWKPNHGIPTLVGRSILHQWTLHLISFVLKMQWTVSPTQSLLPSLSLVTKTTTFFRRAPKSWVKFYSRNMIVWGETAPIDSWVWTFVPSQQWYD